MVHNVSMHVGFAFFSINIIYKFIKFWCSDDVQRSKDLVVQFDKLNSAHPIREPGWGGVWWGGVCVCECVCVEVGGGESAIKGPLLKLIFNAA